MAITKRDSVNLLSLSWYIEGLNLVTKWKFANQIKQNVPDYFAHRCPGISELSGYQIRQIR